jgi:cytochrome c oxidase assembly protein subunit 15
MASHRLAVVTMVATMLLILLGGLVTNTGAALAVPDWPTTFGHTMFLYPWSQMVGGILYEHSHRLMGAVVGVLTLMLGVTLWSSGTLLRVLGLVAVATVCVQGLLGGLRVILLKETLAIVHGCLAQAFFALIVTIAFLTSPWARLAVRGVDPAARGLAVGAALLVYAQIVLGALLTHTGWIELHVLGAVAVFALVPMVAARLGRTGDPVARPLSRLLILLLGGQLLLGVGSYLTRFSSIWIPGAQVTMLVMPVTHRVVGALILAATVVLAVRVALITGVPVRSAPRRLAAGFSG